MVQEVTAHSDPAPARAICRQTFLATSSELNAEDVDHMLPVMKAVTSQRALAPVSKLASLVMHAMIKGLQQLLQARLCSVQCQQVCTLHMSTSSHNMQHDAA